MTIARAFASILILCAAASALAQPVSAPAAAADPDATCVIALATVIGRGQAAGGSPLNPEHREYITNAVHFYSGRLTARYPADALAGAMIAANRAFPQGRAPATAADCIRQFGAAMTRTGTEGQRAFEALGIREGQEPAPLPATAVDALHPDMRCFAMLANITATLSPRRQELSPEVAAGFPLLENGMAFYLGLALDALPGDAFGAAFATALRARRPEARDGAAQLANCLERVDRDMGRMAQASRRAGEDEAGAGERR